MVKETVDEYQKKKLIRARMAVDFKRIMEQESPELKQSYNPEHEDHIITIWREMKISRVGFFRAIASKVKRGTSTITVGYVNMQMGSVTVVDRNSYGPLKRVAEKLPWIETIERDWKFDVNEDIPLDGPGGEGERQPCYGQYLAGDSECIKCIDTNACFYDTGMSTTVTPSEPTSKTESTESTDMKPRYEKIKHQKEINGRGNS